MEEQRELKEEKRLEKQREDKKKQKKRAQEKRAVAAEKEKEDAAAAIASSAMTVAAAGFVVTMTAGPEGWGDFNSGDGIVGCDNVIAGNCDGVRGDGDVIGNTLG